MAGDSTRQLYFRVDSDDDEHFCGRCRSAFGDIGEFFGHKTDCRMRATRKNLKIFSKSFPYPLVYYLF